LRSGQIDALVMWDAMLGAAENTGLKLRMIDIPLQDELVGTTLATSAAYAASNPKDVAGYCRAMTKGLVFTMTNKEAAVRMLWDEFPSIKPTSLDDATALKNGVHVMDRFLEMSLQGQTSTAPLGAFITDNWQNTRKAYVEFGKLKGGDPASAAYTTQFIQVCNDFDRAAIVAQGKGWKD
jgi:NitT/TauT family transport system substrate-binding protein